MRGQCSNPPARRLRSHVGSDGVEWHRRPGSRAGKLGTIEALLLIYDVAIAEGISEVTLTRFGGDSLTFVLEVLAESAMPERIGTAAADGRTIAVGCAVSDEADALSALRAGADEAVVMREPVEPDIHAFVDRTLLRAGMRREDQARLAAALAELAGG